MKFLAMELLALAAVASARNVNLENVTDLEDLTAYGYLTKIGLPLAESIRKAEEEGSQTRIVGGSASRIGQFPYQAGLVITIPRGTSVCGGSLISPTRVLTAAHCCADGVVKASLFEVVLGSITLFSGGTRVKTSNVVVHENWIPKITRDLWNDNDIAIIRMNEKVRLSHNIAIIRLPTGTELLEDYAGKTAVASGFGRTSDGGSTHNNQFLSHVSVAVITNTECRRYDGLFIKDSHICISGSGGRGTCEGDSGGPLAITTNGKPLLIGVGSAVSGLGCQRGHPAIFTRVTCYIEWINNLL